MNKYKFRSDEADNFTLGEFHLHKQLQHFRNLLLDNACKLRRMVDHVFCKSNWWHNWMYCTHILQFSIKNLVLGPCRSSWALDDLFPESTPSPEDSNGTLKDASIVAFASKPWDCGIWRHFRLEEDFPDGVILLIWKEDGRISCTLSHSGWPLLSPRINAEISTILILQFHFGFYYLIKILLLRDMRQVIWLPTS